MKSYIIRIVLQQINERDKNPLLDGVVEDAEGIASKPFHNADELWSILSDFPPITQHVQETSKK